MLAISALTFTVVSFTSNKEVTIVNSSPNDVKFEIPNEIQTVIDNSCYGCHNNDSKSAKSKMKLNFDKMADMKTGKLVSKLSKISKVLKKGKMPPQKFLDHYPDKALSKEDSEAIIAWTDGLTEKLSGE